MRGQQLLLLYNFPPAPAPDSYTVEAPNAHTAKDLIAGGIDAPNAHTAKELMAGGVDAPNAHTAKELIAGGVDAPKAMPSGTCSRHLAPTSAHTKEGRKEARAPTRGT